MESKIILFIYCAILLIACTNNTNQKKVYSPNPHYLFVQVDTSKLTTKKTVYVPIYSNIYWQNGESTLELVATLSIRNISYTDSIYLTDITYYGSQGEVLKKYIDSTLLLKPMTSYEFVVAYNETKGGVGANFIVKWAAERNKAEPLIQSVMVETTNGISFITNGVDVPQ